VPERFEPDRDWVVGGITEAARNPRNRTKESPPAAGSRASTAAFLPADPGARSACPCRR